LHTTIGYDSCLYLRHPLTDQPTAIQQAASHQSIMARHCEAHPPFCAWLRSPYPFFPLLPNQTREPWHQLQIDGQNRKWKHEICDFLRCRAFDLYEKQFFFAKQEIASIMTCSQDACCSFRRQDDEKQQETTNAPHTHHE
jgi:hypothetical protein